MQINKEVAEVAAIVTVAAVAFLMQSFKRQPDGKLPHTLRLTNEKLNGGKNHPFWKRIEADDPDVDQVLYDGEVRIVCNFDRHPELRQIKVDVSEDQRKLVFQGI